MGYLNFGHEESTHIINFVPIVTWAKTVINKLTCSMLLSSTLFNRDHCSYNGNCTDRTRIRRWEQKLRYVVKDVFDRMDIYL